MTQQTLAQMVRAKYPGAYDDLSDQQLESSVRAKFPGVYDDLPLSGAKAEKPKDSNTDAFLQRSGLATIGDFVIGALKGGGETAINLGRMIRSIPGSEQALGSMLQGIPGASGLAPLASAPVSAFDAAKTYTQPTNTTQAIGKGAEQFAELMVPAAKVAQATRGLGLGARMLAEGAAGAGMNAAQGASPTAGAVMGAAIPAAGAVVRGGKALLRGAGAPPVVREAVDWGISRGIPVDAATASGAPIVRAIQGAADATPLGGVVAAKARNQADEALTWVGRGLAGDVAPDAQDMLSAGEAVKGRLGDVVRASAAKADDAYGRLRQIEAGSGAPKGLTTVVSDVSPEIQKVVPSPAGTPFRKLRREEQDAIRSLHAEMSGQQFSAGDVVDTGRGEFSGGAFGMAPGWVDSSAGAKAYQAQAGSNLKRVTANADAVGDIGSGLTGEQLEARIYDYMQGGKPTKATDRTLRVAQRVLGMVDNKVTENPLRSGTGALLGGVAHPITKTAMDTGTTDILKTVESELARHGVRAGNPKFDALMQSDDIPQLLEIVGSMRENGAQAADVAEAVKRGLVELIDFKPPTMAMVVDLAPARKTLEPIYQRMMRAAEIAQPMGAEARALQAMDRLMRAEGQHAPLSIVDDALSDLKGVLRSNPDKLGRGAGALNSVVSSLDAQVQAAAKRAGPEAVAALKEGRAATISKYAAANLADSLGESAEKLTQRFTNGDVHIKTLRDLAAVAPDELPKIGRAVVDDLLGRATAEGGFSKAQGVYGSWQKMGDETKKLLFKPDVQKNLDRFFLLAKRMGESPNPSMSGTITIGGGTTGLALMNPSTGVPLILGAGALSKLLHSPQGASLVMRAMSTPKTSAAYPGLLSSLSRAAGLQASQAVTGGR